MPNYYSNNNNDVILLEYERLSRQNICCNYKQQRPGNYNLKIIVKFTPLSVPMYDSSTRVLVNVAESQSYEIKPC